MKIKNFLKSHRPTVNHVVKSTLLIGATTTIVFGISAGTFSINYVKLYDINNRIQSAKIANYYSQNIKSEWNINDGLIQTSPDSTGKSNNYKSYAPNEQFITRQQWENLHGKGTFMPTDPLTIGNVDVDPNKMKLDHNDENFDKLEEAILMRYKYASLVLDGSTHSALDHSFNQSLYSGIANFIYNSPDVEIINDKLAQIYKPGQDTNSYFQDIYREASRNSRVVCLGGYNHVSPLTTLANQDLDADNNPTSLVKYDNDCAKTAYVLIDGDIPNNQNVASVLFRSDQPAFLTGLATCAYFYYNLEAYHLDGQPLSVAIYGGTAIPTVTIYMGGYQRGIEFFNRFILHDKILNNDFKKWLLEPSNFSNDSFIVQLVNNSINQSAIKDLSNKAISSPEIIETDETNKLINSLYDEFCVKVISLGGTSTHFTGSFVPGDAIGITKQYLNRGASAIICVAGPQSLDTAQEIKNRGSKCIVIGVDSAMEISDYQRSFTNQIYEDKTIDSEGNKSSQSNNIIKFSAVKDMTTVCDKIIRLNAGDGINTDDDGHQMARNWDVSCEPYEIEIDLNKYKPEEILVLSPNDDNIEQKIIDAKNKTINCINMMDFTKESEIANLSDKIPEGILENWSPNANGCIKFNSIINNSIKKYFIDEILLEKAKLSDQWFLLCPDANKSICNIGYKTCGNIQNGLISISFDGWYFLIKALLATNDIWFDNNDNCVDFTNAWQNAAEVYLQEHPDLPEELINLNKLLTFNKQKEIITANGSRTTLAALYNHIMNILGQLFSSFQIVFDKDMSIDIDNNNDPIALTASKKMTILNWLTTNMYFCS